MNRDRKNDRDYVRPHVPPATPPVVDRNADAQDAAQRAQVNGDSDYEGTNRASLDRSAEEARIQAGHAGAEHGRSAASGSGTGIAAGDTSTPGQTRREAKPGRGDKVQPTDRTGIDVERDDTEERDEFDSGRKPADIPPETLLPPD